MTTVPRRLAQRVHERAAGRCEYCRLSEDGQEASFHFDHVCPRANDGPTTFENLALACVSCSLRKLAKQSDVDPETGLIVELYNPRTQGWNEHFEWKELEVVGKSATGRATIVALKMNRLKSKRIRFEEVNRGRHPPN